ncbi:hypothetical protein Goshw_021203 [Gossypium schwendimanii]|uniref:Uncharacterized protein n=3 Tax=Gossypium TaxID=3633 RepID=A0A7J9DAU2_9ROSI|nr:hypothetical protein [Gossypium lobatum]MBA0757714.1 hypothetical protein [Gossypium trilobum]MBA0847674.1 hypothetical protein [Gossypium schwendimanii]
MLYRNSSFLSRLLGVHGPPTTRLEDMWRNMKG